MWKVEVFMSVFVFDGVVVGSVRVKVGRVEKS